jgi:methionyl-tRNA formyltransferase
MKKRIYTNIHPSFLPDLKGIDPVIGAILYNRLSGATCHLMNDTIDTGDIISQVKIPFSEDLDVSLLYQLSFIAEKQAFRDALNSGFAAKCPQVPGSNDIYYTRSMKDRCVTFSETNLEIINKAKAFNNKSQGCFFIFNGREYRFYEALQLHNQFLLEYSASFSNLQIIFVFEDSVVFKKDGQVIKFSRIADELTEFKPKQYFNPSLISDFSG